MKRHIFLISDGTGITVGSLGQSLLSQFQGVDFSVTNLPYINKPEKAEIVLEKINKAYEENPVPPIVFTTIVNAEILDIIQTGPGLVLDFIQTFIEPLEATLGLKSTHTIGKSHGMKNHEAYKHRIDALNFSLNTDDGNGVSQYEKADIILVGVSRSGKTPTSLYLALHESLFVSNYPITEEDLENFSLPKSLQPYANKIFGLTINVDRLVSIRQERKPNSRYATKRQCEFEVKAVEKLYKQYKIPYLDSTFLSIEELATKINAKLKKSSTTFVCYS
jgi:regulator of PEP synthase PpsR (kinase-PPPase family)